MSTTTQSVVCGRPTKRGGSCKAAIAWDWYSKSHPPACWKHITRAECAQLAARQADEGARRAAAADLKEPACWSWPIHESIRERLQDPVGYKRWNAFCDWHEGRCAICGRPLGNRYVEDHSHETGMTRGLLCPGCNVSEGVGDHPLYVRYRQMPPAFILNYCEEYRDIFGQTVITTPRTLR